MKTDWAAQARQLSNAAHWAEGVLFGIIGFLAFLQALGVIGGALLYLYPALLVMAGLLIPIILFGHRHEGMHGGHLAVLDDPQQRQHLTMAGLVLIAGVTEIARLAGILSTPLFGYVWPAVLVIIGVLFTRHTQHGDHAAMIQATRFHRLLGVVLILAGLAKAMQVWEGDPRGLIAFVWALILLVAAGLLITYREPVGAYTNIAEIYDESNKHTGH